MMVRPRRSRELLTAWSRCRADFRTVIQRIKFETIRWHALNQLHVIRTLPVHPSGCDHNCSCALLVTHHGILQSGNKLVSAFPNGDNLFEWIATITGSPGTAYEGLTYKLRIVFPADFPFTAPTVTFVTPCFHPNVSTSGDICVDFLKDKWSGECECCSRRLAARPAKALSWTTPLCREDRYTCTGTAALQLLLCLNNCVRPALCFHSLGVQLRSPFLHCCFLFNLCWRIRIQHHPLTEQLPRCGTPTQWSTGRRCSRNTRRQAVSHPMHSLTASLTVSDVGVSCNDVFNAHCSEQFLLGVVESLPAACSLARACFSSLMLFRIHITTIGRINVSKFA